MRKLLTYAPISLLLLSRSPSAILWLVVAVIIDPIKRLVLWAFTHVGKKIAEIFPAPTNAYSVSSVIPEMLMFGVARSLEHGVPTFIGWTRSPHRGMSMLKSFETSARTSPARLKFTADNGCACTAIAPAIPCCIGAICSGPNYNEQPSKAMSYEGFGETSTWHWKSI